MGVRPLILAFHLSFVLIFKLKDLPPLSLSDLEAAVQRAVGLGGTKLDEISEYGITWAVKADPDGNEFCLVRHS